MTISIAQNKCCMEFMAGLPDKFFDLAICDPPYQLDGWHDKGNNRNRFSALEGSKRKVWDKEPTQEYFTELFRVSRNQIIWGGNYFNLGKTKAPIIWDKGNGTTHFADGEFAWTSFSTGTLRIFRRCLVQTEIFFSRMHPTQKPVALYKWLLKNYAKTGDVIFDSHLGSGSSRIAAYDLGFDFYSTELDRDYFEAQEKRFADHCLQPKLFEQPKKVTEQTKLF